MKNAADDVAQALAGKADDVASKADNVIGKADEGIGCLNGACFTGDTPIMTSETSSKRIDEVRAGDLVLSRSEFDPEEIEMYLRIRQ